MNYNPIGIWLALVLSGLTLFLGASWFAPIAKEAFGLSSEEEKIVEARLKFVGILLVVFTSIAVAVLVALLGA